MRKGKKTSQLFFSLFILCFFSLCSAAFAIDATDVSQAIKSQLPGSTQPGVLSNYLSNQEPATPTALPAIQAPREQPSSLGPQASQIKFKLAQVILEGNHVYSDQQIAAIYQDKINKEITVAELQNIVQDITNYYRNNGYILSRAVLPPQHVQHGVVHVQIIEGYIDEVRIIGAPKGAHKMLEKYGSKISQSRPLQLKVMEHYLRLANEIPGMQVKAILEPSKTQTGASDLNLSANEQTLTGSFSYDNYGTRYIGPNQDTINGSLNSIFLSGDATRVTYATTTRPQQLKFYDVSYQAPVGSNGLTASLGKNYSSTLPGLDLATIDINGSSSTYYGLFQYPIMRTRAQNFTVDGGFNYLDSQVKSFSFPLYTDHLRTVKFGGNLDFADRFNGSNLVGLHVEQGLNIFGASNNPNSTTTSRFGADGIFTKGVAQYARVQPLYGRFSVFFLVNGQYSFQPLLAAEQFGFGGAQLGRGYDPAEIIGDKGTSGTLEFRWDRALNWAYLNSIEPYVFYDAGIVWNLKNVVGVQSKQSATSTGLGTRFILTKNFSGNLMISQPLTKEIASLEVVGRGRCPRGQFSLVASL